MSDTLQYSNPRMLAVIPDWPSSFSNRVTARFEIEQTKRGERVVRTTVGAPKKRTFARFARIVDGSDGRTYIAEFTASGFVNIARGDMQFQQESIFPGDARFPEVLALFSDVISAEWRHKLADRGRNG